MYLENPQKQKLDIEFRVYNDGVCFRYALSEKRPDSLHFINEFNNYRIHREDDRWMQKYVQHYEGDFTCNPDSMVLSLESCHFRRTQEHH